VTISWTGSDDTSGLASCSPAATYSGPDEASIVNSGECRDNAGNVGSGIVIIKYDATPPRSTIVSATDASGAPLSNGGQTLFGPASFNFQGSDAVSGVAGFECSLDNSLFTTCSSPFSGGTSVGSHIFQVRALDTAGNVDPTPELFTWTIVTPAQATQKMIDTVKGMGLDNSTQKSLLGPLTGALRVLSDTNPNNDLSVCSILKGFVIKVDQYETSGKLSSTQAASLRLQATSIQVKLGCQ